MPTLQWIGKEAVIRHHKDVPFRLLEPVPELSHGENSGNLLVQGDNLDALKALLPKYAGQVKCIYIDPPYNTGNEGWSYNDNVNSPQIRKWLGQVVGKEGETLDRHDRWLCMMYPRLVLLKQFLRDDGALFISIDDNEVANLRLIMNEIFGTENIIGAIVWKNVTDNNPTNIAKEHEYVLAYAKNKKYLPAIWKYSFSPIKNVLHKIEKELISKYNDENKLQIEYSKWYKANKSQLWPLDRYKYIDKNGIFTGSQSVHNPGKEGYRYDIIHPITGNPCKQPLMGYRFPKETMQKLLESGKVIFGKDESKLIELKVYAKDYMNKLSSLFELDSRKGTNEIKDIFPASKRPFDYPKPIELIGELIAYSTQKNDVILDSFAGSGTTGHAVLKQNAEDGGNRRFILVEMDKTIAENVTAERLRRVANGYENSKGQDVEGLGGGFQYCRLSQEPLFAANGQIRQDVDFAQLAAFVWFLETKTGYAGNADSPLLGIHEGRAIYLLYNGILGDKDKNGGNVLTPELYATLPQHDGPKIIYASALWGNDWLKRENIIFRQTPYELETA